MAVVHQALSAEFLRHARSFCAVVLLGVVVPGPISYAKLILSVSPDVPVASMRIFSAFFVRGESSNNCIFVAERRTIAIGLAIFGLVGKDPRNTGSSCARGMPP